MSDTVIPTTTEVVKPAATKPMSDKDFLASRIAKMTAKPPVEKGTETTEAAPSRVEHPPAEAPKAESPKSETTEEKKPEAKPKDVLSKDVDELTDEEIAELAQKGKSGLLKRIAELTAKRKIAEERAAALEVAMRQNQQQLPEPIVENNPYASIDTVEKLQSEQKELNAFIEWAEDVLFKAEDMGASDIAAVADGKEYTKASIRESLRGARKRRDRYLPAQFAELQARQQREVAENAYRNQARTELSWMQGEDNDVRKNFEAMVKDPRFKKLKDAVPELAPQVEYLVAHAANSLFGRRTIESYASNAQKTPSSPSLMPSETPGSSAAAPSRQESRDEKKESELKERVAKTGKPNDWIALRAAQISKRKLQKF